MRAMSVFLITCCKFFPHHSSKKSPPAQKSVQINFQKIPPPPKNVSRLGFFTNNLNTFMMTFIDWLEAITWGQKLSIPGYKHYQCDKCGQTLDDEWIKSFGMNCLCGGKLSEVDPQHIDKMDMQYYHKFSKKPVYIRGSAK